MATLRWEEARESVEAKVLEQERAAAKKKGSKGNGDQDLDVPDAAGKEDRNDRKEERVQAAKQKKVVMDNEKIAAAAARAMGPLCRGEGTLQKLLAKAETAAGVDAATKKVCEESLQTCRLWSAAARAAINVQVSNKAWPEETMQVPLEPLPFDAADLRIMLQQSNAGCKGLREALPKPKAKAKASASAEALAAKPKRQRTKGPGS